MRDWVPAEKNWSDLANDEVMATFDGQLKTRAVALCVWCLAQNPDTSLYELETLARRDPGIEPKKNGDRINSYAIRQARNLLEIKPERSTSRRKSRNSNKSKVASSLSKLEKALIERFKESAHIVDEFVNLSREKDAVELALEQARTNLLAIPHDHAMTLAEVDPDAAEVLVREQILEQLGPAALAANSTRKATADTKEFEPASAHPEAADSALSPEKILSLAKAWKSGRSTTE